MHTIKMILVENKILPGMFWARDNQQETSCSAEEEKISLCNVQSQTRSIQNDYGVWRDMSQLWSSQIKLTLPFVFLE